MMTANLFRCCLIVITPVVVPIALGNQLAQAQHMGAERAEDVLSKYPSPGQVKASIRKLRLTDRAAFEQIRADFDLAIRSNEGLERPRPAHIPRRIAPSEPGLRALVTREFVETWLAEHGEESQWKEIADYYARHLDEVTLEKHEASGLVLMDVVANGWDDWSQWDPQNERLNKVRAEFPDLHRTYAVRELVRLGHKPAIGLLLRIAVDGDESESVYSSAVYGLQSMDNYEDILQVYIDTVLRAPMRAPWSELWMEIHTVSQLLGSGDRARAFWKPYLNSDVPNLWYCAQKAYTRPTPGGTRWLMSAHEEWQYQNNPDPKVRRAIEMHRRQQEIRDRKDPETGRLSPEDSAELQRLVAEEKAANEADDAATGTEGN